MEKTIEGDGVEHAGEWLLHAGGGEIANLAADALHAAIEDYYKKQKAKEVNK